MGKKRESPTESAAEFGIGKLTRHLFVCLGPDCVDPDEGDETWKYLKKRMIFEKRSLKDSVTQSTQLIAKTWGESLVAVAGVGAFSMLLILPSFAMPIVGLMISLEAFLGGLLAMVIYWIGLAIVTSALSGIFRTALYLYAAEGRSPEGFSADFVQHAFAPKGGKAAALQTV